MTHIQTHSLYSLWYTTVYKLLENTMSKVRKKVTNIPFLIKDLGMVGEGKKRRKIVVECTECHKHRVIRLDALTERCIKCANKNNGNPTHRLSKTRPYSIWAGILQRTGNPKNINYTKYSNKKPPKEWDTFDGFWSDMEEGYDDGLTIDRIDNDKSYSKDNCRWVTRSVQSANRGIVGNMHGYKGVGYDGSSIKKYMASVTYQGKRYSLKRHMTAKDAAIAYDKFVVDNNFPHELNFKGVNNG